MQFPIRSFRHSLLFAASLASLAACATTPPVTAQHAPHKSKPAKVAVGSSSASGHKASLASLENSYKADSDDPDTALAYAQSLRENNRLQRAAIVLDPFMQDTGKPDPAIIAEYAAIQAAMNNYIDAEKYARQSIALDDKNGPAYYVLGIALDAEEHHDLAETAFRQALVNWQGDPAPVLNNLGLNLAAQDSLDEAVETLRKAVALDPDRVEFKRNLRIVIALQAQSPHTKPAAAPPVKSRH